jgi:hypothetical protein
MDYEEIFKNVVENHNRKLISRDRIRAAVQTPREETILRRKAKKLAKKQKMENAYAQA